MPRMPSRVQFAVACAAIDRRPPALQHRLTSAKRRNGRRLKRDPYPLKDAAVYTSSRNPNIHKEMRERDAKGTAGTRYAQPWPRLTADFHLVSNHSSLIIAERFD